MTSSIPLTLLLWTAAVGTAASTTAPASQPAAKNGWSATWFDYRPADAIAVHEATPSAAQVNPRGRPPQMAGARAHLRATTPAEPVVVGGMNVLHLSFRDDAGDVVPALLCTPTDRPGPYPVVVAAHGLRSNKAQVCGQIATVLTRRGFAVIAPDLPLHGERPGDPNEIVNLRDPFRAFDLFRQAVNDVRQCIDLARQRPELDASSVVLAGYSMGSWINSVAGAADPRVRAMVLMVGGQHDVRPAALVLPQVAAVQPALALAHFAGRPLLMLNAKGDTVVTPVMGQTLFDAAAEPKELRWYDGGHRLPDRAYEEAAQWIEEVWKSREGR